MQRKGEPGQPKRRASNKSKESRASKHKHGQAENQRKAGQAKTKTGKQKIKRKAGQGKSFSFFRGQEIRWIIEAFCFSSVHGFLGGQTPKAGQAKKTKESRASKTKPGKQKIKGNRASIRRGQEICWIIEAFCFSLVHCFLGGLC